VVAVLGLTTALRNLTWHDEEALWDEVGAESACWDTRSPLALNGLLAWARTRSDPQAALDAYARTLNHPAARGFPRQPVCESYLRSVLVQRLVDPELERRAAELGAQVCEAKR
jgi:hypothetical protein